MGRIAGPLKPPQHLPQLGLHRGRREDGECVCRLRRFVDGMQERERRRRLTRGATAQSRRRRRQAGHGILRQHDRTALDQPSQHVARRTPQVVPRQDQHPRALQHSAFCECSARPYEELRRIDAAVARAQRVVARQDRRQGVAFDRIVQPTPHDRAVDPAQAQRLHRVGERTPQAHTLGERPVAGRFATRVQHIVDRRVDQCLFVELVEQRAAERFIRTDQLEGETLGRRRLEADPGHARGRERTQQLQPFAVTATHQELARERMRPRFLGEGTEQTGMCCRIQRLRLGHRARVRETMRPTGRWEAHEAARK